MFPDSFIPLLNIGRESIHYSINDERVLCLSVFPLFLTPLCFLSLFSILSHFTFIRCIDLDKRLALKIFFFLGTARKGESTGK